MAEKATGATAAQAEKFADGAGGILRKQKLVRFVSLLTPPPTNS
jgi:hypothetical protein